MIELANYATGMSKHSLTYGIYGVFTTSGNIRGGKKCTRLLRKRAADASPRGSTRNYIVLACASNANHWAASPSKKGRNESTGRIRNLDGNPPAICKR